MKTEIEYRIAEIRNSAKRAVYEYKGIKEPTTLLELIAFDYELVWVISQMQDRLFETKTKFPLKDYSDSQLKIKILEDYRVITLGVIEENKALNSLIFKVTKEFHIMSEKIALLEKENKALKENINL